MISVFDRATYLSIALLIGSILAFSNAARAAEVNPLRPVDTASPRETLQDFVVTMDGIYRGLKNILQEYAASQRLYLTSDERRRQVETLSAASKAIKVLDLRCVSPIEFRQHRDDLRCLSEFPRRVGAHRADPLDAALASLDQIPDRRGRIMAMARTSRSGSPSACDLSTGYIA